MSTSEKNVALSKIAKGKSVVPAGKSKYRIGHDVVHVRFCSTNIRSPERYKFNINPNTLSADYELWVCGSADVYYLMPISLMEGIYRNPNTYIDRRHPEIRVVSVDINTHTVMYASGGVKSSLRDYLGSSLNCT